MSQHLKYNIFLKSFVALFSGKMVIVQWVKEFLSFREKQFYLIRQIQSGMFVNCHCLNLPDKDLLEKTDLLLASANEVCEGYVFTPVCHSVHKGGRCLSQCMLGYTPEQTHPPRSDIPREQTPPSRRLLLRTVRILLECILVFQCIYLNKYFVLTKIS